MYAISETVPVNPAGMMPVLSKSQVWQGLVMKAENALPFVPAMESCEIVERYSDGFLREIVLRGDRMRERITFTPEVQVHFQRISDATFPGWISNLLSESGTGPDADLHFCDRVSRCCARLTGRKIKGRCGQSQLFERHSFDVETSP